ncbi:predicted protein [Histoplasma capsulatum var. duboisii H88]|uniref:Predicted protein n=1 Tax=Ajellomyces capsulatus (strain H88) TaxID=544711 RepID=F0UU86_AJEC8|nr:predicted protein [Histoplasma capsulatum var. duboisii H88]
MSFCDITRSETPITLGDSVFYTVKIKAPIGPDIIGDVVLKATAPNTLDYDINFPTVTNKRCFKRTMRYTPTTCGTIRVLIGFMPKGGRPDEAEYANVDVLEVIPVEAALAMPRPNLPPPPPPPTLQSSPPNPFSRTG